MKDAVKETLLARVYDVAVESPLEYANKLSDQAGCEVYLKREDLQPVHSFKLRGAYNKMVKLTNKQKNAGVIAASAGNHAQGVALSANKLGLDATIVMPKTTPEIKVLAVKSYGVTVILHGNSYQDAYEKAIELSHKSGQTFIHPFDDLDVIAGQGTVGREILEQLANVTHIFIPCGGGGLLAGIAQYAKQLKPDIKIIGVEPAESNAMQLSLLAGKRIKMNHVGIFADGVAVKQVGELTFDIAKKYVDEVITVSNDQICTAIKNIFEETRSIVEPAGALGVAGINQYTKSGLLKKAKAVAICSGANMSFERLQYIAERTMMGSGRESIFAVHLPEAPGALQRFCDQVVNGNSISEFNYRVNNLDDATIFVGVTFQSPHDRKRFIEQIKLHNYGFADLTDDEVAKEHIRHMIGGKSNNLKNERIFEIGFPEKPGALGTFLKQVGNNWNISLFHYRGQGADTGKVLIGFEAENEETLITKLKQTDCEVTPVLSIAVSLFL